MIEMKIRKKSSSANKEKEKRFNRKLLNMKNGKTNKTSETYNGRKLKVNSSRTNHNRTREWGEDVKTIDTISFSVKQQQQQSRVPTKWWFRCLPRKFPCSFHFSSIRRGWMRKNEIRSELRRLSKNDKYNPPRISRVNRLSYNHKNSHHLKFIRTANSKHVQLWLLDSENVFTEAREERSAA